MESLGHDVLIDGVIPYLDEPDIISLSMVSKALNAYISDPSVWHDLFFKKFGFQPNPYSSDKWPEVYRWRSKAGLYTWGETTGGRLGYLLSDVPQSLKTDGRTFHPGVCKPFVVEKLSQLILSDVAGAGFSFSVLSGAGDIYGVGELYDYLPMELRNNGRSIRAYPVFRGGPLIGRFGFPAVPRIGIPFIEENQVETQVEPQTSEPEFVQSDVDQDIIDYSNSFSLSDKVVPKKLEALSDKPVKFVSITCGRTHLLALSDDHDIYTWDIVFTAPGIKIDFSFNKNSSFKKVRKISAGWNYSAALFEGVGIVVWFNRSLQYTPELKSELEDAKKQNKSASVDHFVVPYTNYASNSDDYVVDFMTGDGFLVYLTSAGGLYKVIVNDENTVLTTPRIPLTGFTDRLTSGNGNSQFIKITGSYHNFGVISNKDDVFLGDNNANENTEPVIHEQLQKVGCLSIATGDHHFLALLKGGKLLSWGRESQECGALGLGQTRSIVSSTVSTDQPHMERNDLVVPSPMVIDTHGKHVIAIAAGGWQSCAIMTTEELPSD